MDVIYLIEPDERAADLLARVLKEREIEACAVIHALPADISRDEAVVLDIDAQMSKPYRLGDLLDRIQAMRDKGARPQILRFDNCELDAVYCVFYAGAKGDGIKLTEKETEILVYLATHSRGAPVKREDLLAAVWGYGDNIETHTLETHIYRLRQKIEVNPAEPVFLVTSDEGYRFPAE